MEAASDFAQLELRFVDQIQWRYELIRPLVLFEDRPARQRAHETHTHPETVRKLRRRFQHQGMLGLLLDDVEVIPKEKPPRVSEAVVEELARLKALYAGFHARELARIVFYKLGERILVITDSVDLARHRSSSHKPVNSPANYRRSACR